MTIGKRIVLHFFIPILLLNNVTTADLSTSSLKVLFKILGHRARSPLIVVIDKPSQIDDTLKALYKQDDHTDAEILSVDTTNDKKSVNYIDEILRSTGDDNDPIVKEAKEYFQNALRSRCEAFDRCEVKCKEPKKRECKKTCKEVYDYLQLCPPGGKKKRPYENSDEGSQCGQKKPNKPKCGKTLPPSWRF